MFQTLGIIKEDVSLEEKPKLNPQPEPPFWIRRTVESEIRYMQEGLEIIKTIGLDCCETDEDGNCIQCVPNGALCQ